METFVDQRLLWGPERNRIPHSLIPAMGVAPSYLEGGTMDFELRRWRDEGALFHCRGKQETPTRFFGGRENISFIGISLPVSSLLLVLYIILWSKQICELATGPNYCNVILHIHLTNICFEAALCSRIVYQLMRPAKEIFFWITIRLLEI